MAHNPRKKNALRAAYVFNRLNLTAAARAAGVSLPTARRWKAEAETNGDNWERARTAVSMSNNGMADTVSKIVEDFLMCHQAVMDGLKSADIPPAEKADALASLADTFSKTMKAAGRASPELSRLSVANDILQKLGAFVTDNFPQHADAFLEILTPFAEVVANEYA